MRLQLLWVLEIMCELCGGTCDLPGSDINYELDENLPFLVQALPVRTPQRSEDVRIEEEEQ